MEKRVPSILLVHDDSDLLDSLTRVFESRGYAVSLAPTTFSALSQLEERDDFDVIIAGWDPARGVGAEVYRWVLARKYHLRTQFVFVAGFLPDEFDQLVQGRCLAVDPADTDELVRIAASLVARPGHVASSQATAEEIAWIEDERPTLLLVEDQPAQLTAMSAALSDAGFQVTAAESGNEAIGLLQRAAFDVILSDWFMPNGSGGELYQWLLDNRPAMARRCVFVSGGSPEDFDAVAVGRPLIPKGQDAAVLLHTLSTTARQSRGD